MKSAFSMVKTEGSSVVKSSSLLQSPNSTHQAQPTSEMVHAIYGISPVKHRFGKRPPSSEPDGVFNQAPPMPTKLMRSSAIYLPKTIGHKQSPNGATRGTSSPSTILSSQVQDITLHDINGASVQSGKEWKPEKSASPRRLVTPMDFESTTCCSPNLTMMVASKKQEASAAKPALVNTFNRRKLYRKQPSIVRFKDVNSSNSQFPWGVAPKDDPKVAKPVASRGHVTLFPPRATPKLYPTLSDLDSCKDTSMEGSQENVDSPGNALQQVAAHFSNADSPGSALLCLAASSPQNAPIKKKGRRKTIGKFRDPPAAKNLLNSYSPDTNRRHSVSAFAPFRHSRA